MLQSTLNSLKCGIGLVSSPVSVVSYDSWSFFPFNANGIAFSTEWFFPSGLNLSANLCNVGQGKGKTLCSVMFAYVFA